MSVNETNYVEMDEVFKKLQKTKKDLGRLVNKAVNSATPIAESKLKKNTPHWDNKKYMNKSRGSYTKTHMKEAIVSTKARNGVVEVGFNGDVSWRVHFVEFGTVKQKPNAFVQKTINEIEKEIEDVIANILRMELIN